MELQDFIRRTLVEIRGGLRDANDEVAKSETERRPFVLPAFGSKENDGQIMFDIAVTVSEESGSSGGGGIKVMMATLGGKVEERGQYSSVTRIKFFVQANTNIT